MRTHHNSVNGYPVAVFTVNDAKTNEIVYIGAGWDMERMYRELMTSKKTSPEIRQYIQYCKDNELMPKLKVIKWFPSREVAQSMRTKLIAKYRPLLNKQVKALRSTC